MKSLRPVLLNKLVVATAGIVFLTVTASAVHAMVKHVSFDDLVNRADLVFHGRVVDQSCRFGPGERAIFTDVTFEVDEVVLHRSSALPLAGNQIVLSYAGGTIDGQGFMVTGNPTFETGQRFLVFTLYDGVQYSSPLIGGPQGKFPIATDGATGIAYPLSSGRRFITGIGERGMTFGDRVASIEHGKVYRATEIVPDRRYAVPPRPANPSKMRSAYAEVARFGEPPSTEPMTLDQLVDKIRRLAGGAVAEVGGPS